jgi:hypothetical protein
MPTELTAIIETTNNTDKSHKERVHVEKLKIYHPRNPNEWRTSIFTRLHNFLRSIQQLQDFPSSPPCVQGSHSALQRAILHYRQHTAILLPIQLYRAPFYTKEPHSTLRHLFRHYCTPLHTAVPLLSFEGYRLILPSQLNEVLYLEHVISVAIFPMEDEYYLQYLLKRHHYNPLLTHTTSSQRHAQYNNQLNTSVRISQVSSENELL